MSLCYLSFPKSHDSVRMSLPEPYQDPETEAAKWDTVVIHSTIHTCAFLLRHVRMSAVKKDYEQFSAL